MLMRALPPPLLSSRTAREGIDRGLPKADTTSSPRSGGLHTSGDSRRCARIRAVVQQPAIGLDVLGRDASDGQPLPPPAAGPRRPRSPRRPGVSCPRGVPGGSRIRAANARGVNGEKVAIAPAESALYS